MSKKKRKSKNKEMLEIVSRLENIDFDLEKDGELRERYGVGKVDKTEQLEMCEVERTQFSDVCLTLVDCMCDISRITKTYVFKEDVLYKMLTHIINCYYTYTRNLLSLDYITDYTIIADASEFEPLISGKDDYYKRKYEEYKCFREAYSLAVITELSQSDVVQIGESTDENGKLERFFLLKDHMVLRKVDITNIVLANRKIIYQFGLGLLHTGFYLKGQILVEDIKNDYFRFDFMGFKIELGIEILVFIALNDKYVRDKSKIIDVLVDYIEHAVGGE